MVLILVSVLSANFEVEMESVSWRRRCGRRVFVTGSRSAVMGSVDQRVGAAFQGHLR